MSRPFLLQVMAMMSPSLTALRIIGYKFGMIAQGLVTVGMIAHERDGNLLDSGERRFWRLPLGDDACSRVGGNPLRKVMDAAGIGIYPPITVADGYEGVEIIAPGIEMAIGAERQSGNILHQRRTVELTGIHHESFLIVDLQSVGHIGSSKELTGEIEGEVGGTRLTARLIEQLADRQAVRRQGTHLPHRRLRGQVFFLRYFFFNIKL